MIVDVILTRVKALSRCSMPVLQTPICLCTHQNIICFELRRLRSPSNACDRHVFCKPRSWWSACQLEGELAGLEIKYSHYSISIPTGNVSLFWIKFTAKHLWCAVTQSHLVSHFSLLISLNLSKHLFWLFLGLCCCGVWSLSICRFWFLMNVH